MYRLMQLSTLPDDVDALKRLILDQASELTELRSALVLEQQEGVNRALLIEKLKLQIAQLRRAQFGQSSERFARHVEQLELIVEDLESTQAQIASVIEPAAIARPDPSSAQAVVNLENASSNRREFPAHLVRQTIEHPSRCECERCGGAMLKIGEEVSEVLEYVPASFKVIRHVRPKMTCPKCHTFAQAPAPARPIDRGLPGAGLLAHVLVGKYADHLPLYRQSEIYAREGVELSRSTLADWVGSCAKLLDPLVLAIKDYVLKAAKLHADDTPVPVLDPGRGKTKTGRLWTYVRDDRPSGSTDPPAVWFGYSADRRAEHPMAHLGEFSGVLQADAYAGFEPLYDESRQAGRIFEAACWAHARRKFYDIAVANKSPIATEALRRIRELYEIEADLRGQRPEWRRAQRQLRTKPRLDSLHHWLTHSLSTVSKKSQLAEAMRYSLSRWGALTRFCEDGLIEIDNNIAERSLRACALGRKNFLFAGSDAGGERVAAMYCLVGCAKLNDINPEAYLTYLIERIAEHPITRIAELLPWNVAKQLQPEQRLAA